MSTDATSRASSATEHYPIRSYEIDAGNRLTVPSLCNYLQESAGLHARQLGVSVEQLRREGMTWFLWRLHVRTCALPAWGEVVTVETWPAELGKPFAIRDFRLRHGEHEIGVATSAWLLMDIVKMRPIRRFPAHLRDLHPDPPQRALADSFHRLPGCEAPSRPGMACDVILRRGDLDLNGHLNHVAAIAALLEAAPAEFVDRHRPASLEAEFRGEGRYGDPLQARCRLEDSELQHVLVRKSDGKELARARSRWRADPGEWPEGRA